METLALARAYADKIKQQIGAGFTPKIVESLPTVGDAKILYLVLKEGTAPQGNIYNEYLWINGEYEIIGDTATLMTVDSALSATSENPVQNKIIKGELDKRISEPSTNGLVRKVMGGIYTTMGIDTTMSTSPTDNNVPTTKLLADQLKNPLKLSDENLQKSGIIKQNYNPPGSTPGTTGTTSHTIIQYDSTTLDDTALGIGKIPSSRAVGKYVKDKIANKLDVITYSPSGADADEKRNNFLNYIRSVQTTSGMKNYYISTPINFLQSLAATDSAPAYNISGTVDGFFSAVYNATDQSIAIYSTYSCFFYIKVNSANEIVEMSSAAKTVYDYTDTKIDRPVSLGAMKKYVDDNKEQSLSNNEIDTLVDDSFKTVYGYSSNN